MPNPPIQTAIKNQLKNATSVVVLCVGSELRGDDGAGLIVLAQLSKISNPKLHVLDGGTAPENMTGEIKRLKPSHLIIVDAADMKAEPGTIKLIEPQSVGGYSFSTHSLPLKVMIDFLLEDFFCEVFIIGLQPGTLAFGSVMTAEIKAAAKQVAASIVEAI